MSTLVYPNRLSIFEGTAVPRFDPDRVSVFEVINRWARVQVTSQPSPEGRRLALEIQRTTGWSERAMARALGTTHPTVGKLIEGQAVNASLAQRVVRAHEVISRIYKIAGQDVQATARALEAPISEHETAAACLSRGAYAEAYLAAIDVLRPRERGILVGGRPTLAGRANVPLVDEP